jgi:hypothetical protein
VNEEQLTVAFAVAVSRRQRELGAGVRRGTPEAAAFGTLAAGLRAGLGLDRTGLAARARLDPVQLAMIEQGLLGPDEIPAIAVARIAAGLGRRLSELPLTPYEVDEEPGDHTEVRDGETRLRLGLATLEPWVAALVTSEPAPPTVWLPEFALGAAGGSWQVRDAQLTTSPLPVRRSDDYSWHALVGRGRTGAEPWSLFARLSREDGGPAAGVEVALTMGAQRQVAATDARGAIAFGRLDVADLDPLRFAIER